MYVTQHARQRIEERTSLPEEDIIRMLEEEAFKRIGGDGKDKQYCLMYSSVEDMYFVCVVNMKSELLVTFLSNIGPRFRKYHITDAFRKTAKHKWKVYCQKIEQSESEQAEQARREENALVPVTVRVRSDGDIEFTETIGEIEYSNTDLRSVLQKFDQQLQRVLDAIERWEYESSNGEKLRVSIRLHFAHAKHPRLLYRCAPEKLQQKLGILRTA